MAVDPGLELLASAAEEVDPVAAAAVGIALLVEFAVVAVAVAVVGLSRKVFVSRL
jgi:hypothetical protein